MPQKTSGTKPKRDQATHVMLTADEVAQYEKAANAEGQTFSEWARQTYREKVTRDEKRRR